MLENKLIIELLSDLCTGNGSGNASIIDVECTHDQYGFVYIPAKRIKGCLREVAEEMAFCGGCRIEDVQKLFGNKNVQGDLSISNGYLKEYDTLVKDVEIIKQRGMNEGHLSQEDILSYYTRVLSQTKIERSGVAKDDSLRKYRVIKQRIKDNQENYVNQKFEFDITIETEKQKNLIENSAKLLRNIGIRRNRGLGHVQCKIDSNNWKTVQEQNNNDEKIKENQSIVCTLKAKSKLIFLKDDGGTYTYIPGSYIRGYLANSYIKKYKTNASQDAIFQKLFLSGDVKITNGYIVEECGEKLVSYEPCPNCIVRDKEERDSYLDLSKMKDTMKQIISMKGKYVSRNHPKYIKICTVKQSEELFIKRDKKKIIDKVPEKDTNEFYQFSALEEGQAFQFKIVGKEEELNEIKGLLCDSSIIKLGKYTGEGYGKCLFNYSIKQEAISKVQVAKSKYFRIVFRAPIIVQNDKFQKNTFSSALMSEMRNLMDNMGNIELCDMFLDYQTINGYNGKWGMERPEMRAFAAGTTILFRAKETVSILSEGFAGLRQEEGFGQYITEVIGSNLASEYTMEEDTGNFKENLFKLDELNLSDATLNICREARLKLVYEKVKQFICNKVSGEKNRVNNTTLGQLRKLVYQENIDFLQILNQVSLIVDHAKRQDCIKILAPFAQESVDLQVLKDNKERSLKECYEYYFKTDCYAMNKITKTFSDGEQWMDERAEEHLIFAWRYKLDCLCKEGRSKLER